jgi:antirestriction protein ArdC
VNGVRKEKTIPLLRAYPVFNAAQVEGIAAFDAPPDTEKAELRYTRLKEFLTRTQARVEEGGDMAFYSPTRDFIQVPKREAFLSEEHYWSTMLHELTHWTGHESRLDRDVRNKFGTLGYAAEELVAELGSAYLCAALHVEGELRHPEYLAHWLKGFKDDKRVFFRASSLAQKAADFVLAFREETEPSHAPDSAEDAP